MIDTPASPQTLSTSTRSRLPLTIAVALLLLGMAAWAILQLANGIEFRSFQQQIHSGDPAALTASSIAQSFQSPDPNLSRIELQLATPFTSTLPEDIHVTLRSGDNPLAQPLYDASLATASVLTDAGDTYVSISFPPRPASTGKTYTLVLTTPSYPLTSVLPLSYSPVDALSSGQLYIHTDTQPGDLAITTYYRYTLPLLLSDIWNALTTHLVLILAVPLLFLLPGLALLLWLPNDLTPGQRLLAAPALTALTLPLIFLYCSLVNLSLGPTKLWLLLALSATVTAFRLFLPRRRPAANPSSFVLRPSSLAHSALRTPHSALFWLSLILLILIAVITRLISLRGLYAGVGMDAYHHTLITDLFVHNGIIPHTYQPYAPLNSFTYHFGFHTLAAAISLLSGQTTSTDLMTLVPQVGQLASSVLPIPTLTLFGWKVLGNRWLGLTAAALAALVSVVPAFYVEWSRFTQGQGLGVLPLAFLFLLSTLDPPSTTSNTKHSAFRIPHSAILAVLSASGLFLTHYRIAIIYAAFAALYLAWFYAGRRWSVVGRPSSDTHSAFRILYSAFLIALGSLLVLSPWLLNLRQNFVKNFIDTDVVGIDVYFATAERLGTNILHHPSLPILAILSSIALAILGWRETRLPRAGLALGALSGLIALLSALCIYLNSNPVTMEHDLQTLFLGLSPVTWLLLIETALIAALLYLSKRPGAMLLLPALVWLVLALFSSPQLFPFRLPLVGYMDAVTLASGAWLPTTLLSAYTLTQLALFLWNTASVPSSVVSRQPALSGANRSTPHSAFRIPHSAFLAVALLTTLATSLSLSPVHDRKLYITQPDEQALLWMRTNLPKNSYVLANSFSFPWSPTQVLGVDSGLWIPFISLVPSSVQPIAAYNEQPADPSYFDKVLALVPTSPLTADPAQLQSLKSKGITHIFIGSRAAGTGFSPQQLLLNKSLKLIYHKDAIWLFQIL